MRIIKKRTPNKYITYINAFISIISLIIGIFISPIIIPEIEKLKIKIDEKKYTSQIVETYWTFVNNNDFKSQNYINAKARLELFLSEDEFNSVEYLEKVSKDFENLTSLKEKYLTDFEDCKSFFFPSTGIAFKLFSNDYANHNNALKSYNNLIENYYTEISFFEKSAEVFQGKEQKINTDMKIIGTQLEKESNLLQVTTKKLFAYDKKDHCNELDDLMPSEMNESVPLTNEELLNPLKYLNENLYNEVIKGNSVDLPIEEYINIATHLREFQKYKLEKEVRDVIKNHTLLLN